MAQIGLEAVAESETGSIPQVEFRCIDRRVLEAWIGEAVALGFKEHPEPEPFSAHPA